MLSTFTALDWLLMFSAAFIMGLSKAGIKGTSIVVVALMVMVFDAKASTGVLLPMLIMGDIFAVFYYNRHAQWKYLVRMLPFMMVGVLIGVFLADDMEDYLFRKLMAVVILLSVLMMFWWDQRKSKTVPTHISFAGVMGLTAGFTTMVGNLAGSFVNIFFLAMRLPKNAFLGTTAWLFLITNLFKVPFHIWSWKTINVQSIEASLSTIPAILIGLFVGIRILKRVNEALFRKFILIVTALGAVLIFFT